ncbi:protein FAR1-RELATED SEQUENCE 5-like, partial [Sesbania bispinosa]
MAVKKGDEVRRRELPALVAAGRRRRSGGGEESSQREMESVGVQRKSHTVATAYIRGFNKAPSQWAMINLINLKILKQTQSTVTEKVPKLGMEFNTIEEAMRFWTDYGGRIGFDVRQLYANKSRVDKCVDT